MMLFPQFIKISTSTSTLLYERYIPYLLNEIHRYLELLNDTAYEITCQRHTDGLYTDRRELDI